MNQLTARIYSDLPGNFNRLALQYGSDAFNLGKQFTTAWYSIKPRWEDCCEFSRLYTEATYALAGLKSTNPNDVEGYWDYSSKQERSLFFFLYLGLSALETLVFGLYFLAARRYPEKFPIKHEGVVHNSLKGSSNKPLPFREVKLDRVSEYFCRELSSDALSAILYELRCDKELKDWKTLRDEFTHRMTPFRHSFYASDFQEEYLVLSEKQRVRLDENTTRERLKWLGSWLDRLIEGTNHFLLLNYPEISNLSR